MDIAIAPDENYFTAFERFDQTTLNIGRKIL